MPFGSSAVWMATSDQGITPDHMPRVAASAGMLRFTTSGSWAGVGATG